MELVKQCIPACRAETKIKRTVIGLDILANLIRKFYTHPALANMVAHAGDSYGLSKSDLLRELSQAMSKPPGCFLALRVFGRKLQIFVERSLADRLFGSHKVTIQKTKHLLGAGLDVVADESLRCWVSK